MWKKIHRLRDFCQNSRNKSWKEVRVDMNFLWVGLGWCELSWVNVSRCELFMGGCELFMGGCELVWTFYGLVWVGAQNHITGFICFNESPLKMIENAVHFMLKALFLLKILKFLCWLFGHVEKAAWLER